jgi:hypothetical protein
MKEQKNKKRVVKAYNIIIFARNGVKISTKTDFIKERPERKIRGGKSLSKLFSPILVFCLDNSTNLREARMCLFFEKLSY